MFSPEGKYKPTTKTFSQSYRSFKQVGIVKGELKNLKEP